jgi:hypothetical protein
MLPRSEIFFETGSDLSIIWPSFYVMVPRLSDKFQKWSLVVGDGGGGDDDDDDDYDNTKA